MYVCPTYKTSFGMFWTDITDCVKSGSIRAIGRPNIHLRSHRKVPNKTCRWANLQCQAWITAFPDLGEIYVDYALIWLSLDCFQNYHCRTQGSNIFHFVKHSQRSVFLFVMESSSFLVYVSAMRAMLRFNHFLVYWNILC